jgi:hypothetical protein
MAKFELKIESDDEAEFSRIVGRLSGVSQSAMVAAASEIAEGYRAAPAEPEAPKPTRGRKTKTDEAPPADSTVQPSTSGETTVQTSEPAAPAEPTADPATTAARQASEAPATDQTTGGDVTFDMLKQATTELLKKTSAAKAQEVLRTASGGAAALSNLDPSLYAKVHAALVEAAA